MLSFAQRPANTKEMPVRFLPVSAFAGVGELLQFKALVAANHYSTLRKSSPLQEHALFVHVIRGITFRSLSLGMGRLLKTIEAYLLCRHLLGNTAAVIACREFEFVPTFEMQANCIAYCWMNPRG